MSQNKLSFVVEIDTSAFEESMRKVAELVESGELSFAGIEEALKQLKVSGTKAPYSTGMMKTGMGQRLYDLACQEQKRIEREKALSCVFDEFGRRVWL